VIEPPDTTDTTHAGNPAVETSEGAPAPAPASEATPLRVAGFLSTVLGAALMGSGALMHWLSVDVHLPNDVTGVLNPQFKGIDTGNGKMALLAAAVLLIGLMALRVVRSFALQERLAVGMVVAAGLGIAFSGVFLVNGGHRLATAPTDSTALGIGVIVTLAGAVVGLVGAILDLAWSVAPH